MMRRGRPAVLLAAAVVAVSLVPVAAAVDAGASGTATGSVTVSKTVFRNHLVNGADDVVDTRHVTMTVSQTVALRDRQEVNVTWSGARPTAGIIADQNSGDAKQEEYPFVLLECRGIDSPTAPVAERVDPTTCWTQTSAERYQDSFNTAFPPWRVDRYATAAQRQDIVAAPPSRPPACGVPAPQEYWVPFVAVNTTYYGGSGGCAGMAPEAANVGALSLPSNTTYGVTELNGTGSASFDVWTAEDNASLGCSDTVPCALVAVPIMGISCDIAALSLDPADRPPAGPVADDASTSCMAAGKYAPGQVVPPVGGEDPAVSGALWWATSNWQGRLSVPLTFAPLGNVCDIVSASSRVDVYGSELLTQASTQWAPTFCLNPKLFRFNHIQTGEPQARNLLSVGNIEAAFVSRVPPGAYPRPVVSAPVAVTGFGIVYSIDDAQGRPYTQLKLTPRLLAKLLTESYPAINAIKSEDNQLAQNPLDISLDPEFQALNPGIVQGVAASESASTLLAMSSDSDVMYALTSYIEADPEARAWLAGAPDPWGMVVNPAYRGISLPVDIWPLRDTFEPPLMYASAANDCLHNSPVPYLPLVAAPALRLATITQAMQFTLANSTTVCQMGPDGTSNGEKLVPLGRQTVGYRFMIGVTSLGDAARYQLATAALQTQVSPSAPGLFTTDAGRTFVAPSTSSLAAATRLLAVDPATGTWPVPYDQLHADPAGAAAYPGTMVVYASVPTSGLPAGDAKDYAELIRYLAGRGQTPGPGSGQLPAGYLPISTANGLAAMASEAGQDAAAVAAQHGGVPGNLNPSTVAVTAPATASGPQPTKVATTPTSAAAPTAAAAPTTRPVVQPVSLGTTSALLPGPAAVVVPLLLLIALGGGLLVAATGTQRVVRDHVARRRAEQ